jgi:hypothetical protein
MVLASGCKFPGKAGETQCARASAIVTVLVRQRAYPLLIPPSDGSIAAELSAGTAR